MPNFASILEDVERDAATRDAWRQTARPRLGGCAVETEARPAPDLGAARAAYAAQTRVWRVADEAQALPTLEALRRDIAAARDAAQLRRLRRLAARALHPDRGGDCASLADCNALIDAALRTSRRRT